MNKPDDKNILAICGKGGVGKTALSALLSRALLDKNTKPLLLIDADPAGGLVAAIGESVSGTLAGVREELINSARNAGDNEKEQLAHQLDYLLLQSLLEKPGYSVLAMGRSTEKGCFCPANALLREAIRAISGPFAAVIIDAEAGLEQINRRVTRDVTHTIVVTDGSQRSIETMAHIREIMAGKKIFAVANRVPDADKLELPEGIKLIGTIPEDQTLLEFDRRGRSLWKLPHGNLATESARRICDNLKF